VTGSRPEDARVRFAADWLALREPVDHRSRAHRLVDPLLAWWGDASAERAVSEMRVVDLGAGTGSNLRYLAPRLSTPQSWTLVDRDAELLRRVDRPITPHLRVTRTSADLADVVTDVIDGSHLVTASALLDLVSDAWLMELVDAAVRAEAAVLVTLTYDGSVRWRDPDADDDFVRDAVNAHQQRNKGLGAGLGPAASRAAEVAFRGMGYRTLLSASPWHLGPGDTSLVRRLVEGWYQAAVEERPNERQRLGSWADRRRASVSGGHFGLTVGHMDLLALPPEGGLPQHRP
jgi:hypothetical protein